MGYRNALATSKCIAKRLTWSYPNAGGKAPLPRSISSGKGKILDHVFFLISIVIRSSHYIVEGRRLNTINLNTHFLPSSPTTQRLKMS